MIVLISFNDLERSLFEKASGELRIANRISYFEDADALIANRSESSKERAPLDYPRVIVMNIDAPNCLSDLRQLKQTNNWMKIPVIGYGFLTGETDVSDFYGAGAASCIRKPATYAKLGATTRAAMGYWLSMSIMPCDYLREA
jgi:DNA-binding response OmpR family regulator